MNEEIAGDESDLSDDENPGDAHNYMEFDILELENFRLELLARLERRPISLFQKDVLARVIRNMTYHELNGAYLVHIR